MILDYKDLNEMDRYKVMSDTIIPRPIAWIVTEDNGILNAAPFSYFIPISSDPALVIVAIGNKSDGTPKDTLANILKTKKATICFVNKDNLEQMKKCAKELKKEESEIEQFEIEVETKLEGYPPMISSSQSALFCKYYSKVELPSQTSPIILEIKKEFVEDARIDYDSHIFLDNIGRSGLTFKAMVQI